MPINTSGFGTLFNQVEGGTAIPDGSEIEGTYEGSVVCIGDVTLSDDLTVRGDLIVHGTLTNAGGYAVNVSGDLIAGVLLCDKEDTSTPQQDWSIGGDFIFTYMTFRQCAGTSAYLYVGGSLTCAPTEGYNINGEGVDGNAEVAGTPGLHVHIKGDCTIPYANLYGGSNTEGNAGGGGQMTVLGNCTVVDDLYLHGGNATGGSAGSGGSMSVQGNLNIGSSIYLYGGEATDGDAGNGGDLSVDGVLTGGDVYVYGGECTSDSESYRSGNGGSIYVQGGVSFAYLLSVRGGDRYGNLETGNDLTAPYGGTIDVNGDLVAEDLFLEGGDVNTISYAPHAAGDGGSLNIEGNLTVMDDLQMEGGYANVGVAGNGGTLDIEGSVFVDDDFDFNGGYAENGSGGNGGSIYIYGNASLDEVRWYGGDGTNGNGGNGASIFIKGSLYINEYLSGSGGSCNSTNEAHVAGSGVQLHVEGDFVYYGDDDDMYLEGGSRSGATTVSNLGASPPNGGSIDVGGNLTCRSDIYLNGGSVFTEYPHSVGGYGGSLNVGGTLTVSDNIYLNGGRSVANTGGYGGSVEIDGFTSINGELETIGGDSVDSVITGDAAAAGSSGSLIFRSGVALSYLYMLDGNGATSPSDDINLYLGGSCTIGTMDVQDRPQSYIRAFYSGQYIPVMLKMNDMVSKNTLNIQDGTATGVLTDIESSIFVTGPSGLWYAVVGTAV